MAQLVNRTVGGRGHPPDTQRLPAMPAAPAPLPRGRALRLLRQVRFVLHNENKQTNKKIRILLGLYSRSNAGRKGRARKLNSANLFLKQFS